MIAAIDSDPLCYSVGAFCNPHPFLKDLEGKPLQMPVKEEEIAGLVMECIDNVLAKTGCDQYVTCLSSSVSSNFRDEIAVTYPYKGKRIDSVRPYHHQTVVSFLQTLDQTLVANHREADDDLADLALADPDNVVICTIDKDLDGVHNNTYTGKLKYYNWKRDEYYELTHNQRYKFFCKQLLTGDWSTDCILGCGKLVDKVYGPKAQKAGQQYQARVGIGPKAADNILISDEPSDWMPAVIESYKQTFGDDWEPKLLEMGRLLFMGGSSDNLWHYKESYND